MQPHVTLAALVRDATFRLPGGVGTRGDIVRLFCQSQYVRAGVTEDRASMVRFLNRASCFPFVANSAHFTRLLFGYAAGQCRYGPTSSAGH